MTAAERQVARAARKAALSRQELDDAIRAARTAAERRIARAARKAALSRQELDDAIRAARAEGLPLRTIAAAANLSPEWVRKIAGKDSL